MKQRLLPMTLVGEVCAGNGTATSSRGKEEEVEEAEEKIVLIRYQGVRNYAWVMEEKKEEVLWSLAK
jgi:hypothetical protein